MTYEQILVEERNEILYIIINRPEKLNALNQQVLSELSVAVSNANTNPKIKGLIITGSGEKAFVAGADIAEFSRFNAREGEELARNGQQKVFNVIENLSKPAIAAINGFALGGGLELALACHIRIASTQAKLGLPEVTLGLIPGYGGTQRLTKLVGKSKAIEMIITAEMIDANQAEKIGLVNHITAPSELLAKAESILEKVKNRAPLAVEAALKAINAADTNNGFETEIKAFSNCFSTKDFKEGVAAFLEKRKPKYIGQ